mgnify:FL=1|jgi:hypothetical protein
MIKFFIPAIIVFLIILFWDKISDLIYKKFNIKLNYLLTGATILIIVTTYLLIRN